MIIKVVKPGTRMDKSDSEGRYWESDVIEINLDLLLSKLKAVLFRGQQEEVIFRIKQFFTEQLETK